MAHGVTSVIAGVAALAVGCSDDGATDTLGEISSDFLWGAATSSHQVEGRTAASDWRDWEEIDGKIDGGAKANDGPLHYVHFDADFAEAKSMGHNAYRLSLDWARLQSGQGAELEPTAVQHYKDVFASLRRHGLTPVVTLQHFTLPRWIQDVTDANADQGGWKGRDGHRPGEAPVVSAFEDFAMKVGTTFGDDVDWWMTINEPMLVTVASYIDGRFPPGGRSDFLGWRASFVNMTLAHAKAYHALHAADTTDVDGDGSAASVSVAKHLTHFTPSSEDDDEARDRTTYTMSWSFLNALTAGDVDANFDGDFDDEFDRENDSELAGTLDWLGVHYYTRFLIKTGPVYDEPSDITIAGIPIPEIGNEVQYNDMNWEIFAPGFRAELTEVWQRYQLPIMITENGIADDDDDLRPAFIVSHIEAMQQSIGDGAQIFGYLHWSLLDNFEWAEGLWPRFGLLRVDYDSPNRARTRTQGADAYAAIIAAGGITEAIRAEYGELTPRTP